MPSAHLKFIIPGAILAAIGGFMLFIGAIFAMISRLAGGYGGYYTGGSMMYSTSLALIFIGSVLLCVGIVLLAKGVKTYRSVRAAYYKNRVRPMQPVTYTPSPAPAPSYAPSYTSSYAPITQTPPKFDTSPLILDTPSSIQDPTPAKESITQDKKYCPSCGATLPEHTQAHFCPTCGGAI